MNYKKNSCAFSLSILLLLFLTSFRQIKDVVDPEQMKVMIVTDYGSIKIKLYNQTPLHRDNFVKLIKEHYFDSLLFHRVIQNFMIQGGDPDSKHAAPTVLLGEGGPTYTIPTEFDQKLFHKKGVLAAAREGDLDNPLRASSASQFYIVQGKVYTDSLLKLQAIRITKLKLFNAIINRTEYKKLLEDYKKYAKSEQADSMKYVREIINKQVDIELPNTKPYTFSEEQIKCYTTVGGTPHLDDSYTVFGEVYEGFDVIDQIASQNVDKNARPYTDIRMKIAIIP